MERPYCEISRFMSPVGPVYVGWTDRGLSWVGIPAFGDVLDDAGPPERRRFREHVDAAWARWVEDRLWGRARLDADAIDWRGIGAFQRAVLSATLAIVPGTVRSYGWVAQEIGRPRAGRAVGQALHTNPLPLLVPCHRVIRSDGTLGGYGPGPAFKRVLLEAEGVVVSADGVILSTVEGGAPDAAEAPGVRALLHTGSLAVRPPSATM